MWGSPLLLSLASVFSLLGLTLVAIAGFSDNWTEFSVSRREIIAAMNRQSELSAQLKDQFAHNPLYFSRSYGLFHICFPDAVPSDIGSFSKLGTPCITNNDYFPDDASRERYNSVQVQRLYFMRLLVVSYVLGIVIIALCLLVGIIGCWKRSPRIILATALIMLFAVLFLAASMALWHYVNYLERRVLDVPPFYRSWEQVLKQTTRFNYGWSYIVAWVGIGFILFAGIFMLFSYKAIKDEEERAFETKHAAYFQQCYEKSLMPYSYGGPYGGYNVYPSYYTPQYPTMGSYGYMTYGGH